MLMSAETGYRQRKKRGWEWVPLDALGLQMLTAIWRPEHGTQLCREWREHLEHLQATKLGCGGQEVATVTPVCPLKPARPSLVEGTGPGVWGKSLPSLREQIEQWDITQPTAHFPICPMPSIPGWGS